VGEEMGERRASLMFSLVAMSSIEHMGQQIQKSTGKESFQATFFAGRNICCT